LWLERQNCVKKTLNTVADFEDGSNDDRRVTLPVFFQNTSAAMSGVSTGVWETNVIISERSDIVRRSGCPGVA
jgi:hypothetical protein